MVDSVRKLEVSKVDLEKKVQEGLALDEKYKEKMQRADDEIRELKAKSESLKKEVKSKEGQWKLQVRENAGKSDVIKDLEASVNAKKNEIAQLRKKILILDREKVTLHEEVRFESEKRRHDQSIIGGFETEINQLTNKISEKEHSINTLHQELQWVKRDNKQLKNQLDRLLSKRGGIKGGVFRESVSNISKSRHETEAGSRPGAWLEDQGIIQAVAENNRLLRLREIKNKEQENSVAEMLGHNGFEALFTIRNGDCFYDAVCKQLDENISINELKKKMNDVAKKCLGMDGAEYLNTRNNSRDDLIFKENLLQTMREFGYLDDLKGKVDEGEILRAGVYASVNEALLAALVLNCPLTVCDIDGKVILSIGKDGKPNKPMHISESRFNRTVYLVYDDKHFIGAKEKDFFLGRVEPSVKLTANNHLSHDEIREINDKQVGYNRKLEESWNPNYSVNSPARINEKEREELSRIHNELRMLRATDAESRNASCQGFANSFECYFRGMPRQKVISVNTQIQPVPRDRLDEMGVNDLDAIKEGMIASDGNVIAGLPPDRLLDEEFTVRCDNQDRLYDLLAKGALKDPRYTLMKQSASRSGAAHYALMVRLQSGRYFIVDGQSNCLFPVLTPDNKVTDEAKEYFGSLPNTIVNLFKICTVPDDQFQREIQESNRILEFCLAYEKGELTRKGESGSSALFGNKAQEIEGSRGRKKLDAGGTTASKPLPKAGRKLDVRNIDIIPDYVAGGHCPLVIFDVDDTLIADDIIGGKMQKTLVNKNTAQTIKKIREKAPDAHIILLTQSSSAATLQKLQAVNLDKKLFDSIECVDGDLKDAKGTRVIEYIGSKELNPKQVCFIDDSDAFLEQVEKVCKTLDIHCNTFHFRGAEEMFLRVLSQIPDTR